MFFKKYRDINGTAVKAGDTILICPHDVGYQNFVHEPPTPDLIEAAVVKEGHRLYLSIHGGARLYGHVYLPARLILEDDFRFAWIIK